MEEIKGKKIEQLEKHIKTYIIKQYKANSFESNGIENLHNENQ